MAEINNNIDDEVYFSEGIDIVFFDILLKLYKPFLSAAYKKAFIQYTVFSKKYPYPIGIIALNKTKSGGVFFEIALIPELKGKKYSSIIIEHLLKKHPLKKIGWTVHKANLPSIKLLQKLKGGFFEKTVKNKRRIEAEGFFRPNAAVSASMRKALEKLLTESEHKYSEWFKGYNQRTKELKRLKNYLKDYINENN